LFTPICLRHRAV